MGWLASRKCRREGHVLHEDPGDFVLYCTRCHALVDMEDLLAWLRVMDPSIPRPSGSPSG